MSDENNTLSIYMDLLPGALQTQEGDFLNGLLLVFENILSKSSNKETPAISEILNSISRYFYPLNNDENEGAPDDFIEWLSSWVGLVLKEDWTLDKKREVIARIIPIYRLRGTKRGLETYLNIYIENGVTIRDNFPPFIVGVTSKVGESTFIGKPNYFIVEAVLPGLPVDQMQDEMKRRLKTIKMIVDQEKPVHTTYDIHLIYKDSFQVGIHSHVGQDTIIWSNF